MRTLLCVACMLATIQSPLAQTLSPGRPAGVRAAISETEELYIAGVAAVILAGTILIVMHGNISTPSTAP